ncbi:LysM peptidoglycan-binding domain-containing protein [Neobacillus sp. PS3-34]|uniref:LysM peptidoglycan-binding domain-containing protein n=1 Tax=Neobacillus sp. PS3-34 TaxID=3070678 RepID=UPI0027E07CBF|nr:LysM peptidoglycan-binding domain-containing protein [Neobacillus sp. PS3-34]WML46740.1 LysM peptidoglycan-binding domain-containing protein [Neobacillus sp. PS3-34]
MKKQKLYSLLLATFLSASAFSVSAHAESLAYKVKSGETLTSIANRYHVSVSQLKTWNHLTSEKIRIGQTITVSVPEATYKVKKGDLITTIAKNHHLLVADIKISNHLTSDRLKVGQTLKIPSHKGVYLTHTVKTGDSLSLISRDYGLSVSNIKKFNNFTTDKVRIGQVLKLTASPAAHTIQAACS